jgi:predicted ABC-type ATPase
MTMSHHQQATATPRALIVAGPNGAGKTTFSRLYLPHEGRCSTFINADLIAAGLSPFNPDKSAVHAAQIMVQAVADAVRRREDFAVETTLAGRSYIGRITAWKQAGYHVSLVFLALPSVELAIERVRLRVAQGGHDIPEAVIRRRFAAGWTNFQDTFRPLVDAWRLYDAGTTPPTLLAASSQP